MACQKQAEGTGQEGEKYPVTLFNGKYKPHKFLGKGYFGEVVKCTDITSGEEVAVKIIRGDMYEAGQKELFNLQDLPQLDVDKLNVVRFIEDFEFRGHFCLVFEKLDTNLFSFMKRRGFEPMPVSAISLIAQQIFVALEGLGAMRIVHTDIKPDNIMLVEHTSEPFRVKLIDFGLAEKEHKLKQGCKIQPVSHRAPEVILGLPLDASIDMWSMGCVLAYLCQGQHLFPYKCEYRVMRGIIEMVGLPENGLLNQGLRTSVLFKRADESEAWSMKTLAEYKGAAAHEIKNPQGSSETCTTFDELHELCLESEDFDEEAKTCMFLDLLKRILVVNPRERITPRAALQHSFITKVCVSANKERHLIAESMLSEITMDQPESPKTNTITPQGEAIVQQASGVTTELTDLLAEANFNTQKQPQKPTINVSYWTSCTTTSSGVSSVNAINGSEMLTVLSSNDTSPEHESWIEGSNFVAEWSPNAEPVPAEDWEASAEKVSTNDQKIMNDQEMILDEVAAVDLTPTVVQNAPANDQGTISGQVLTTNQAPAKNQEPFSDCVSDDSHEPVTKSAFAEVLGSSMACTTDQATDANKELIAEVLQTTDQLPSSEKVQTFDQEPAAFETSSETRTKDLNHEETLEASPKKQGKFLRTFRKLFSQLAQSFKNLRTRGTQAQRV